MTLWRSTLLPALAAAMLATACADGAGPIGSSDRAAAVATPGASPPAGTAAFRRSGPDTVIAGCVHTQLRVAASGGGPAAGYVAIVLRFTNAGSTCLLDGWPQVEALNSRTRTRAWRHVLSAPALVGGTVQRPSREMR